MFTDANNFRSNIFIIGVVKVSVKVNLGVSLKFLVFANLESVGREVYNFPPPPPPKKKSGIAES